MAELCKQANGEETLTVEYSEPYMPTMTDSTGVTLTKDTTKKGGLPSRDSLLCQLAGYDTVGYLKAWIGEDGYTNS